MKARPVDNVIMLKEHSRVGDFNGVLCYLLGDVLLFNWPQNNHDTPYCNPAVLPKLIVSSFLVLSPCVQLGDSGASAFSITCSSAEHGIL